MKTTNTLPPVTNSEWFRNWFDSSFYHKLYANRNEAEAIAFIDALLYELEPAAGTAMLDLGCGNGRHSKYLASKGFDVTGIDLSASSIREAKRSSTASLCFLRRDMRMDLGEGLFDYVFSFFTSFGYFEDPCDDYKVIRNIAATLTPGGTLLLDYINSPYAEKKLLADEEKEIDGVLYHIQRWTDEKRFYKKISIAEHLFNKPLEYTEVVKKFSVEEFEDMLNRNGLRLVKLFGDYELNDYDRETSPRMILLAKKP